MKLAKRALSALLAFALCLMVAGCTDGSSTGTSEAPEGSAAAPGAESAATDEPVTIRILSSLQSENPEGPLEKSISDAYTALHPNVTFEYISVKSNEYWQKLTAMGTAGDMPDMFQNSYNNLPSTIDLDVCLDLSTLFDQEYLDGIEPHMLAEATYNDQLLFMPTQSMPAALLYRKDWFDEKGLQPPTTWDELAEYGKQLTEDTDGDGQIDRYGFAMIGTKDSSAGTRIVLLLRSFGCREFYFENGEWKTDVGGQEFKNAIQTFADLDIKHHIAQPGVIETSYSEAANLMVAGKAAMMLTGSNALGTIYAQNPELQGKLASCAVPAGTVSASSPRTLGYSIYKESQHKEICEDYLKFFLEKENAMRWTTETYRVPVRLEYYDDPILQGEDMKGFVDALSSAYAWPQFLGMTKSYEIIGTAYQSLILGTADVDTAAAKAQQEMEELIASYE